MMIENVHASTLMPIVLGNVARKGRVMTYEHSDYRDMKHFLVREPDAKEAKHRNQAEQSERFKREAQKANLAPPTQTRRLISLFAINRARLVLDS